jgi:hypothetical protein
VTTPTLVFVSADNTSDQLRDKATAVGEVLGEPVYAIAIDDLPAFLRAVGGDP